MLNQEVGSGLADPVHDAQAIFRAVLDALAHPGTLQPLPPGADEVSALSSELAAVLLALCDHDTSVWLSPSLNHQAASTFVGFHTGAPVTADIQAAQFAFVAKGDALPELALCNAGTQEYPDRSTTLVVHVEALSGGPGCILRGPGIRDTQTFAALGLPANFTDLWAANHALFPRGVDLILVAHNQVLGLPRSTRIVEA